MIDEQKVETPIVNTTMDTDSARETASTNNGATHDSGEPSAPVAQIPDERTIPEESHQESHPETTSEVVSADAHADAVSETSTSAEVAKASVAEPSVAQDQASSEVDSQKGTSTSEVPSSENATESIESGSIPSVETGTQEMSVQDNAVQGNNAQDIAQNIAQNKDNAVPVDSPEQEHKNDAPQTTQQQEVPTPEVPKQPEYNIDELYPEIVAARDAKTTIDVVGLRRVRGGILAAYKGMPLFLPTSHLSLKANPSENELLGLIQQTFPVHVHELNDDDKTKVIVTRRKLLRVDHLKDFQVGQIVEGKVVSFTDFGAFINLGEVDGMVHVSAISRRRVKHPSEVLKKGDIVRAVVKEINENTQRLSLSMRELEPNPWQGAAEEFKPGSRYTGIVKSITDFGVYVELKKGVEGLIHISEMSWARRIKHPSELFQAGQSIEIQVLDISEEKQKVSLGYKQTQPNPWASIAERFKVGDKVVGVVREVIERGVVINIAEDIDAFMPKGKMHPSLRGQAQPFTVGDTIEELYVMDVVPENHSLILGMEGFDQGAQMRFERPERSGGGGSDRGGDRGGNNRGGGGGNRSGGGERGDRRGGGGGRREPREEQVVIPEQNQEVSLADLLSEDEKRRLFGTGE
jgi:small subunit ribosomal protein S1